MRRRAGPGFDEAVTPTSEMSGRRSAGRPLAAPGGLGVLAGIERCYDALPRMSARTEAHGPFTLFIRTGDGWPYYARPRLGWTAPITAADVAAMRARQRELGEPESLEWVHELAPTLRLAARTAGLAVRTHPLMALDATAPTRLPAGVQVRTVGPDAELPRVLAVAQLAFAEPGSAVGSADAVARDKAAASLDPRWVQVTAHRLRSGVLAMSAAYDRDGPVAVGSLQTAASHAEISGVGTLPARRRRGLAAALTGALAQRAVTMGVRRAFLSANDAEVARVYARVGFRTVGLAMVAAPPAGGASRLG